MKLLLQRVRHASVRVDDNIVGQIGQGLLVFIGIEPSDRDETLERAAHKISNYRVFNDDEDKMNLSVSDIGGDILLVSQFTLAGDTRRGMRPSFSKAAKPDQANVQYLKVAELINQKGVKCETGRFGADMKVELLNDGPVTFLLEL